MAEDERAVVATGSNTVDTSTALVALTDHVAELTLFVGKLDLGLQAALDELPDEAARATAWADAQKTALGSFYDEAQKYTTAIVAGGYAAYFTILSLLNQRFDDTELSAATLSITVSLSIFVLHEVYGMIVTGIGVIRGSLEKTHNARTRNILWGAAVLGTLLTALPAMIIMMYVCIKHLV